LKLEFQPANKFPGGKVKIFLPEWNKTDEENNIKGTSMIDENPNCQILIDNEFQNITCNKESKNYKDFITVLAYINENYLFNFNF